MSLLLSACGGGGTRGTGGAPIEDENARREVAEQQLLGAQALEEQGRLEEAAYAYEHLWRLYPLPRFLILAARTHDRRGARCSQRLAAWRRASQRCAGCRFQEKIDLRLSAVGSCDREVRFISEPAGAIISVRGERLGKTPLTHRLEPGEYQVVATLGAEQQSASLTLGEGAAQLQFTFSSQAVPTATTATTAPRGATNAQLTTAAPRLVERSQGDLNLKVKLFCEHRSPERGTYLPLHQCDAAPLWEDDRFRVQVETNQA
ncbi:MAG: PEGA domain-containing protein, partial [Myxococcota bacterium]|nr:PEGA domain-containing protein [Myxococcota bacterium]